MALEFIALIPARLASTRLPNKPLADIAGKPMIVRVAEQARRAGAAMVVVATDSAQIVRVVEQHGGRALLTRGDHLSGTDRLAEAAAQLRLPGDSIVVNVQGDEPLLPPELIRAVAQALADAPHCAIATAAHPIHDQADYLSPNVVKVICKANGEALYFSRAPIPFDRDFFNSRAAAAAAAGRNDANNAAPTQPNARAGQLAVSAQLTKHHLPLRHIGLYAYRAAFLATYPSLPPAAAEQLESLEQLRALAHGYSIHVMLTDSSPPPGVDTAADLERVRQVLRDGKVN